MSCADVQLAFFEYNGQLLSTEKKDFIRTHLDMCKVCWAEWNTWRWDRAINAQVLMDLQDFLREGFEPYLDSSWKLADEWTSKQRTTSFEIEEFYRTTKNYLYNLAIWEGSGKRASYVEQLHRYLTLNDCKTVLDLGCGIGSDGIRFLNLNYNVCFYDISIINLDFVKFRLSQREFRGNFTVKSELKEDMVNFDVVWAMDVIEHINDPIRVLKPFLKLCSIFVYDTDHDGTSNGRQPFHFQHDRNKIKEYLVSEGFYRVMDFAIPNVWKKLNQNDQLVAR